MSYFDKQNGGADDSEDEKNNDSGSDSGSDSDLASDTNIDDEINDEEDDDAEAKGLEDDDDDDEGEEPKINFKEKYGVDFASNDDEDLIVFARKHKEKMKAEYGEDFGNNQEEDIKNVRKYFAEQREKAETETEADDASETDESHVVTKKKTKKMPTKQKTATAAVYDEEDDEDPTGEAYLQKFDKEINDNYLVNFHPESVVHNYDEIMAMTKITRDKAGIIIDDLHKTIPFLTKYERARVLGQRAKQINSGASVFVKVPEKVIDGYLIAELELQEKRIPFIIRRPMPNGGSEYWSIKDLENIAF